MGIARQNPLGIEVTDQLNGPNIVGEVQQLHQRILEADRAREDWLQKQTKLLEQRRGIRKTTRFPWVGANNENWPLTDAIIRRWKPGIVSLVNDADPVAWFWANDPSDVDPARQAQAFYHWLFTTELPDMEQTAMALADTIAQTGIAYTRQGWEYRTDKMARIVSAESLFPGGVEAAYEAAIQAASAQAQQAGQQIDATQFPQLPDFVRDTLKTEYQFDENLPNDAVQLEQATAQLLQGAQYVKVYFETIVADRPSWKLLDPRNVIIPSRTRDVSHAEYICIEHRMTADDIMRMAADGTFREGQATELVNRIKSRSSSHSESDSKTLSTSRHEHDRVLDELQGLNKADLDDPESDTLWEIYCKMDIDGDGLKERVVVWFWPSANAETNAPEGTQGGGLILSVIEYPFPFEEWPIVQFEFEHTMDRPYASRGIAELVHAYQKSANRLHNARLDAIQVVLSPMMQMRSSAGQILRNLKFRPGLIVPVQQVGDIAPIPTDAKALQGFLLEENKARLDAEQYIGTFDPGVLSQNASERRTATEVEAVTSQIQSIFTQDATLFQRAMAKVHKQLWQLWLDFGPEEVYFRVIDEDQPKLAVKADINKEFDISPAGTPANTNKQLALARAREVLQILFPDQSGVVDKSALLKYYLDLIDRNLSKLVVRTPEEAAAIQQLLQTATELSGQEAPSF